MVYLQNRCTRLKFESLKKNYKLKPLSISKKKSRPFPIE